MLRILTIFSVACATFLACSASDDGAEQSGSGGTAGTSGSGGSGGTFNGTSIPAAELCDELVAIACKANEACCDAVETPETWPGVDAGTGGAPADCESTQLTACRGGLGKLAQDPRTGYDAEAAAKLAQDVQAAAASCWSEPIAYAQVTAIFAGTGAESASCTPENTSVGGLQLASFSCEGELSCSIFLNAAGDARGRCEAREGNACSHPIDCPTDKWCDAADWRPGVTGQCNPLKANGWDCVGDFECESSYCDAAKRCQSPSETRFCLSTPYASEVMSDHPALYLRFSEAPGAELKNFAGAGSATKLGGPEHVAPGSLAGDIDGALRFDGVDDGVDVPAGAAGTTQNLAIELWFKFPEDMDFSGAGPAQPILAFGGDEETSATTIMLTPEGKLFINLRGTDGQDRALTSDAQLSVGEWHHLAVSYDGFKAEAWVDGSSVAALEEVFTPDTSAAMQIGYTQSGLRLRGDLDELAIYVNPLERGRTLAHRSVAKNGPANTSPLFKWFAP